jgi:hypothetical protein
MGQRLYLLYIRHRKEYPKRLPVLLKTVVA